MDHPDNVAGSDDIAGDTPDELKHRSDGDPKTDVWASPTCQRCLSFFHPELAEPVPNEPQTPVIDLMENYVALHLSPAGVEAPPLLEPKERSLAIRSKISQRSWALEYREKLLSVP